MAEKKAKDLLSERNQTLNDIMDYGGTAKVGEKEYEKKKKKKSAIATFIGQAMGQK
jgi:hypothetical protein